MSKCSYDLSSVTKPFCSFSASLVSQWHLTGMSGAENPNLLSGRRCFYHWAMCQRRLQNLTGIEFSPPTVEKLSINVDLAGSSGLVLGPIILVFFMTDRPYQMAICRWSVNKGTASGPKGALNLITADGRPVQKQFSLLATDIVAVAMCNWWVRNHESSFSLALPGSESSETLANYWKSDMGCSKLFFNRSLPHF